MSEAAAPATATAETLVLVGCGQMGSAMLRGWVAREAAANFIVVEPTGLPARFATAGQRRLAEALLAAIGDSAWVEDEALLDAVTAVSGSGPAYVFLLIEALAEAGERVGLPPNLALRLARETVAGSGELARRSPDSPARLRENVTS